jgi:23S rRNA pseudouridine1911/1915/1917 synthase
MGRRAIQALFAEGRVRVNGRRVRKGSFVQAGDTVTVTPPEAIATAAPLPALTIVDAIGDVIAIDKPPGVPSTVGRTPGPSIAAALAATYPEMATLGGARHAGLAHRLDTGTSGLLLAGRTPEAYERLRTAFRRKAVVKDYLAVVAGAITRSRMVDAPLARRSPGRMTVARGGGKAWPARTEITPIEGDADHTLVRLRMRTGVTHQLRVHLASLGHPIVGDRRYGATADQDAEIDAPWHFLHAWRLRCDSDDVSLAVETAFPAHWRRFFAARRWATALAD